MFITQNPAQLKKAITANTPSKKEAKPIRIIYHDPEKQREVLKKIIDLIARQPQSNGKKCFVLGRYNHNKPDDWAGIKKYAEPKGVVMEFSTIHKSKGRETDWVIVLENKSNMNGYGFPSEIQDDPVLRMALTQEENFPHAEERRLFYVAITRARRGVFLLAPTGEASDFIREIDPRTRSEANDESDQKVYAPFVYVDENAASKPLFCPECKGQTIRKTLKREGDFFYGCSYFPLCKGKLLTCENEKCDAAVDLTGWEQIDIHTCDCGHESEICPRCWRGILKQKSGSHGKFWGCSQYSITECSYTKNIPREN